jgi:hypothetical protein
MDDIQIDLLTVVVAAVLNMVIGFLWYSKWLFGPTWAKLNHVSMKEEHSKMALVYGFIVSLVIAYFLAFFQAYTGVTTVTDGMLVGFCAWLGFSATTQISSVIWGNRPFQAFLLDTGCKLLSFLVMSGVIGA